MSDSTRPMRVVRGISHWFTVPGLMVPAGKAFTTSLSRTATTSASSRNRRRRLKKTWLPPNAPSLYKMHRAFLFLTAMGEP